VGRGAVVFARAGASVTAGLGIDGFGVAAGRAEAAGAGVMMITALAGAIEGVVAGSALGVDFGRGVRLGVGRGVGLGVAIGLSVAIGVGSGVIEGIGVGTCAAGPPPKKCANTPPSKRPSKMTAITNGKIGRPPPRSPPPSYSLRLRRGP